MIIFFGLGFFGEVFRGMWNGTEVAVKVFLEQDLTAENMEDFCNEISILRFVCSFASFCPFKIHSKFLTSCVLFSPHPLSTLLQPPSTSQWYFLNNFSLIHCLVFVCISEVTGKMFCYLLIYFSGIEE